MSKDSSTILVYSTCPDGETARHIAAELLEKRLAACINILPVLESHYYWQGKLEQSSECLLMIKTIAKKYSVLQDSLSELHPYELPEIIAVPIEHGLPEYLNWIHESVS